MNPYREAPENECWAVTHRCRCPAPFHFMENTVLLKARDEDDAVHQARVGLEESGHDVLALVDAHPVLRSEPNCNGEGGG